ncbi:hypothetical protein [Aggregatibacter actinomycetemcomitans]
MAKKLREQNRVDKKKEK